MELAENVTPAPRPHTPDSPPLSGGGSCSSNQASWPKRGGDWVCVALLSPNPPTASGNVAMSRVMALTSTEEGNSQNLATTLPNALVMLCCNFSDEIKPHHMEDVIHLEQSTM